MSKTIINQCGKQSVSVKRCGQFVVQTQDGADKVIHTTATVILSPATVPHVGYQQQIDNLAAKLENDLPTWQTTNWS